MTASPLVTRLIQVVDVYLSRTVLPVIGSPQREIADEMRRALDAAQKEQAAPCGADAGVGLAAVQSLLNDWENEMEGDESSTDDSLNRLEQCANELREALAQRGGM